MAEATSTGVNDEGTAPTATNNNASNAPNTAQDNGGAAGGTDGQRTTYGATIVMSFKYDMLMGGDSARFATANAKQHLLQMSQVVPLTIKPRTNKEAEDIEGTTQIATKLSTVQKDWTEYITIVYDKIIQRRGACKFIIDIQTDTPTSDALASWEAYLIRANATVAVVTEREEKKEEMKKALWFSSVQPRLCSKAVVKRNLERLLSEKGKDMPIEVIECFHALPIDVTENGVVSQQKIAAKVLAVKTRKEDVNVLVGNVSRMINQDKINIFNDQSELEGIVNPHPVVHAIPFRANNRYQHLLLSKHKEYMDLHKVPFFLHENVDKVIPENRIDDYISDYVNLTRDDNTLRRMIMGLTNSKGNQAAEAIYSTQRSDFIVCCVQDDAKVIAEFCDLNGLEYKNMWEKFNPNYESDMTREMKALVAEIEVEEKGFYMAPGKVVQAEQIAPSAWKKKPRIAPGGNAAPVAIRTELQRTEEIISQKVNDVLKQVTEAHAVQIKLLQDNHSEAMLALTKRCDEITFHSQQQGEMLHELTMRNDRDQMQITEGFEKMDKNIVANEQSIEGLCQDIIQMNETGSKERHTVVKAMQKNMDTTTKAFKILSDEMTTVTAQLDTMSDQADAMEESLEQTAQQVNSIFESFVTQRRGNANRQKRDRSRSLSSVRSNSSNLPRMTKRQQRLNNNEINATQSDFEDGHSQASSSKGPVARIMRNRHIEVSNGGDDESMSVAGNSLSNSDNEDGLMDGIEEVGEGEDLDLSELEQEESTTSDDDNDSMSLQDDGSQTQSVRSNTGPTIVSGCSQEESARR